MFKLVLLRHGESTWNQENRFTGWTDVDLSEKGRAGSAEAGRLLKDGGYVFDVAYTSVLKRAIRTLWIALDDAGPDVDSGARKSWRLNERHYGALQGLNKAETAAKHGDAQVKIWRRSYDIPPPPLTPDDARYPARDPRYAGLTPAESAADRIAEGHRRALPALLARDHRAGGQVRPARDHRGARQQPARAGEVPRQHLRDGDRRAEHSDRHSARLRAGRSAAADPALLPRRSRSRRTRRRQRRRTKRAQVIGIVHSYAALLPRDHRRMENRGASRSLFSFLLLANALQPQALRFSLEP